MMDKALIMDIKHFAVHDGDGIRTTVFFKGCPLRCIWCHNPEGLTSSPSYSYVDKKCIGCGECAEVCAHKVHSFTNHLHRIDRSKCVFCGRCENVCLGGAIRIYGKWMSIDELLPELLKDKIFYENSGGGVTLSGGECLLQADFCSKILLALKTESINTAIDTCGYVPQDAIDKVLPFTDTFLYDVKAYSPETHKRATGVTNEQIIENLRYIDGAGKAIEVRIPFVPDYNLKEIPEIAKMLAQLKNITKVRILAYHNLTMSKYDAIGLKSNMPKTLPTSEQLFEAKETLRKYGITIGD